MKKQQNKRKQKKETVKKFNHNWSYLLLIIAGILVYGQSLNFGFTIDDKIVISENRNVQKGLAAVPSFFTHTTFYGFVDGDADKTYRPITLSTYALEISLFGLNAGTHHFFSLLYYLILCLLLYILLSKYILKQYHPLLPLMSMLVFLLHPLHTEVISNIKSRDEILCFLGWTTAFIFLLRYLQHKKHLFLLLSAFFYLFALFSKETAVPMLLLIPIGMYFFSNERIKRILILSIPYAGAVIFFLICRHLVVRDIHSELTYINNALLVLPVFPERYAMIFYILLLYIKLLFFPHPLLWDYSWGHFAYNSSVLILGVFSVLIYLALFMLALHGSKQKKLYAYLIWFYMISLALVSNVFIIIGSTMGERFLFIPSFAFSIGLVLLLFKIFKIDWLKKGLSLPGNYYLVFILIIVLFGIKSYSRTREWKDDYTITSADRKWSRSYRSQLSYIEVLYKQASSQSNNMPLFQEMQTQLNNLKKDYPKESEVWYLDGLIQSSLGKAEQSIRSYRECLRLNPGHLNGKNNLASVYHANGIMMLRKGKQQEGIQHIDNAIGLFQEIIRKNPKYTRAYLNLAKIYHFRQINDSARYYYHKTLELDPDQKIARENLQMLDSTNN